MKYSISNIAWTAENDVEMYRFLCQLGFAGLEIAPTRIFPDAPYDHISEAKDWAVQLHEECGLIISSMQSIWFGRQENIFNSASERRILLDYTRKVCQFAQAIQCKNIVFGCPRNRDTSDVSANYPIAVDFFHALGELALEYNTIIAIEANPTIYNTHFINYTEQAVELVHKSNSKGLKVNYDLGTVIYNKEDINYIKGIAEYINHVHISEPGLNLIERRDLHAELLTLLNGMSYNNFVSIEMGNKGELEKVIESLNYIRVIGGK